MDDCQCVILKEIFDIGQKEHFFKKSTLFLKNKAPKFSSPPIQSILYVFCTKIKFCIIFAKGGIIRWSNPKKGLD